MTLELGVYGLVAGLLYRAKTPVFLNLVIAQAAGRLIRATVMLITAASFDTVWGVIVTGLPGIMLQWALIPLIIYRLRKR